MGTLVPSVTRDDGRTMTRRIYALLVGIDEYFPGVSDLGGCKNDIAAVADVLRARADAAGDRLELRTLTDRDATREAVVATFREHLRRAGPHDAALFYYSGHGSQQATPPELWHLEPDHMDETLVCADSRTPQGWDLSDKELGVLLGEVADTGAHVTAVLDCCHSGSGTRSDAVERRVPADERTRPASTFLPEVLEGASGTRAVGGATSPVDRRIVTLSACRSDQTAKERLLDGARRGVFSTSLLALLRGSPLSYRDLHRAALASVRTLADDQTPILEALGTADIDVPFLDGIAAPSPHELTVSRQGDAWTLDAGQVHGITDGAELALFSLGGDPVGTATVTSSQAVTAEVDTTAALDDGTTYRASLTGGVPALAVALHGDDAQLAEARAALAARPGRLREDADAAALALRATPAGWAVTAADSPTPLTAEAPDVTGAVTRLEHVARWRAVLARRNPASAIPPGVVRIDLEDASGTPLVPVGDLVRVMIPAGQQEAPLRVVVRNGGEARLYCALLALTEQYGIVSLLRGGGTWLDPDQEAWVFDSGGARRLGLTVPAGATRARDVLKLLVSTAELDAQALEQPELTPRTATMRGVSLDRPPGVVADDWRTDEVLVETVRGGPA